MFNERNIPAIIQRRLSEEEIRQEEREKIAEYLESIRQQRLPEILHGCFGSDKDGWLDFSLTEKHIFKSLAGLIRKGRHAEKGKDNA